MANNVNYEYIDEASVDPELICTTCHAPFNDPLCTPCRHTFCRPCITGWINTGNINCSICRHALVSTESLTQASYVISNMLDRLPVRCVSCGETGLQRGSFNEHIGKACPKVHVPCPSADVKCPWKGPRDQLNNHITTCIFQPLRSILSELMNRNRQLEEQIKQQDTLTLQKDAHVKQLEILIKQQDAETNHLINQLSNSISTRQNDEPSIHEIKQCDNCHNCIYVGIGTIAGYHRVTSVSEISLSGYDPSIRGPRLTSCRVSLCGRCNCKKCHRQ